MVAQQVLVLFVEVRILVGQHFNRLLQNLILKQPISFYWCPVNFYSAYVLNSSVFKNKFLNDLASSALLLYNKMLNRCAIEFFVKHIQCSFLLFSIHFEARQFGTLLIYLK